jgi:NAD(P)-dependent dehydrogenase (short-subunit alcohol dehydrogenase family)
MAVARSILITGCSTGIGLASARALKARGWRVLATARRPADLDRLAREDGVEALPLELSDPRSVEACGAEMLRLTGGRLDALFNNAAYGMVGAVEDTTPEQLRSHFEVNVIAAHALTRHVVPAMRAQGHGRIVMCSSVLGFVSGPYRGAYAASKFALEALTDALRVEVAPAGIQVSLIEPGPIETEFLSSTLNRFKQDVDIEASPHREAYRRRLAEMEAGGKGRFKLGPEAVVAKLIQALESPKPKARYRVGVGTQGANVLKRVLPARWLDRIMARM